MWDCLAFTLTFDSSPIKGEGEYVVGVGLLSAVRHPCGLRIKSAMTGPAGHCRVGGNPQGGGISPTLCVPSLTSAVAVRRHGLVECLTIRLSLHLTADP